MQIIKQKFQQKLFPQQLHLLKLIELPTLAFEKYILKEIEGNPLLGIDESTYYIDNNTYYTYNNIQLKKYNFKYFDIIKKKNNKDNSFPFFREYNIYEYLRVQLNGLILTNDEFIIADFILGNIDEEGYLRRDYHELIHDLSFIINKKIDEQKIENIIKRIQSLSPLGLGARNLKECLLLQLKNKSISRAISIALIIIDNFFDLFCKKQYKLIMHLMKLNYKQLYSAIYEIKQLNPIPGKIFNEGFFLKKKHIIPDFLLKIRKKNLHIYINMYNKRRLYIIPIFAEILRKFQENYFTNIKNIFFIKKKIEKAKIFINAIKQRNKTLLFTIKAILNFQKEYFLSGEKNRIHPMTLQNISEFLQIKISTVSRVINKKYIETPFGTILVKDLFTEKIFNTFSEEVSSIEIKCIISNIIKKEDRKYPYTDKKISIILKKKGYNISRRTISKYRKQLYITIARLRKILQ